MSARKADTRQKIQLGGLIVKAGLADQNPAVILGALMLAADALNGPNAEAEKERFRAAGDEAFAKSEDKQ